MPGHTNSAVDGFAFRHANYNPSMGSKLDVVARVAAGRPSDVAVRDDAAARIFTGAPMPAELDTVMMQEDCEIDEVSTAFMRV